MFGGTGVDPTTGKPTQGELTLKRAFLMLVILIFDNMGVEEGLFFREDRRSRLPCPPCVCSVLVCCD